jgi:hypothetical protein
MDGISERNAVYAAVVGVHPQLRPGLAHRRAHSESVESAERFMNAFKPFGLRETEKDRKMRRQREDQKALQ